MATAHVPWLSALAPLVVAIVASCGSFEDTAPASAAPSTSDGGGDDAGPDALTGTAVPLITTKVVDALPISLERGKSVDITIQIERRAPFGGPVDIEVTDLPSDVHAAPLAISATATAGTLTLQASESASHARLKPTVNAAGPGGVKAYPVSFDLVVRGAPGSLDETFGKKGIVEGPAGTYNKVAVQADGKVLYAARDASAQFLVGRLLENGLADMTFGTQGSARFAFGAGSSDDVNALLVQSTGNIVVVGGAVTENKVGALRLTPSGALDTTFASQGKILAGAELPKAARLGADGSVYILTIAQGTAVKLIHLTKDGALDANFGTGGILTIPSSTFAGSPALIPQDLDVGALGVTLSVIIERSPFRIAVVRVGLDGKGAVTGEDGHEATQYTSPISVDNDGMAVVAFNGSIDSDPEQMFVRKFLPDGSADFKFAQTSFADDAQVTGIVRDKQGRFLITSYLFDPMTFRVGRHSADNGYLDTTFGSNGVTATTIGTTSRAKDIVLDAESRVILGGTREANGTPGLAIARYWP